MSRLYNRALMRLLCVLSVAALAACGDDPAAARPGIPSVKDGTPVPDRPTPGQAEPCEDLKDKWGFKEGSWVELRVTEESPRGKNTFNLKTTVQKLGDTKVTLLLQKQGAGQTTDDFPLRPEMKKLGTETLDIDGKSFACTMWEKVETRGQVKETMKLWVCKDAPGRVVKHEQSTKLGENEVKGTGSLKKLGQRTTIGSHTVTYATFEFKGSGTDQSEVTISQWVSDQVPGFLVKEEHRESKAKIEVVRIKELVDYEVK